MTLNRLLCRLEPDYIHVHGYLTAHCFQVSRLRHRLSATFVVDDHMAFVASRHPLARLGHFLCRCAFTPIVARRYDAIVAVALESKHFMIQRYGLRPTDIRVIPLGVDTTRFAPSIELRERFRRQHSLGPTDFLIIYTGKHDSYKNPLLALQAAKRLWDNGISFKMLFVGPREPRYFASFMQYIRTHNLQPHVILHEAVPAQELPAFFNAADVAVWPSEATMSALEAMACGCPVILPDLPVNRERIAAGGGLVFRPDNIDHLAQCILRLYESPELREEMGNRAKRYAASLSWDSICDQFLALHAVPRGSSMSTSA